MTDIRPLHGPEASATGTPEQPPLVTVAMPVYNAARFLRSAIDSVLQQTYPHFELVMVNDASSDQSKQIIEAYHDPRIRYFENPENQGIAKTRNRCIREARGKYIAVLDNDDLAAPTRLEKQVRFLETHPEYGMCGSFWTLIDGYGKKIASIKTPVEDPEIKTYLLFNNCFCNSSIMIRKKLLQEFMYPEHFSMIEDYYFLYKNRQKSKFSILPEALTHYRKHGNNTSIEKQDGMRQLRRRMDAMILRDLGIGFSDYQLDMHSALLNGYYEYFRSRKQVKDLESWLLKLLVHLENHPPQDMKTAERILARRWMALIMDQKKWRDLLVFNRLVRKTGLRYFSYAWESLREKYSGTIRVI